MNVKIEESWKKRLADEFDKDYFVNLAGFVRQQYSTRQVVPLPQAKFLPHSTHALSTK